MNQTNMKEFGSIISKMINKEHLSRQEARDMFSQILSNEQTDMQQGAFLAALAAKGATAEEIAGSWEAIYQLDTVKVQPETKDPLVDNCGTGMDSFKTFNISTAASIIAAAGGARMAKHGSRALSSICGTIDILEELGIDVECDADLVKRSIDNAGIGIFNGMSPKVHPMALGRILSQISFGTVLNISASLANPVIPTYGVRGVYSKDLVELVPQIMKEIGYRRAVVVFGSIDEYSGIDEASTVGTTYVGELSTDGSVGYYTFVPGDFGYSPGNKEDLRPLDNKRAEALRLLKILKGEDRTTRADIVNLNAALVLYVAGKASSILEGCRMAEEIVASGKAVAKIKDWVNHQNTVPEKGMQKLNQLIAI